MHRCTSYIWLLGISCINITVATHPTGHTVLWYVRLAHCLYMAHNTPNYLATSYWNNTHWNKTWIGPTQVHAHVEPPLCIGKFGAGPSVYGLSHIADVKCTTHLGHKGPRL